MNIKNSERSVILSYLYANQFAHHCFMNPARRHKTPVSETKDFITHAE